MLKHEIDHSSVSQWLREKPKRLIQFAKSQVRTPAILLTIGGRDSQKVSTKNLARASPVTQWNGEDRAEPLSRGVYFLRGSAGAAHSRSRCRLNDDALESLRVYCERLTGPLR